MRGWVLVLGGCVANVQIGSEDTADGPPLRFTDGEVPQNLLIISVDTTRRDHLGVFSGSGFTPNLDAVLGEAVLLADHHSCSNWTAPSMTCVVTGRTQMEQNFGTWNSNPFVSAFPGPDYEADTLAKGMSNLGKQTLLIFANGVFGPWGTGIGVGYDDAIDLDYQQAPAVAATALTEIANRMTAGASWYTHVHFMDPHGPYCAPDEYVDLDKITPTGIGTPQWCADSYGPGGGFYVLAQDQQEEMLTAYLDLYDGEIRFWDTEFGKFWDSLDSLGALDDTLVVFVTDHGQQFFERGGHGHGIFLGPEENRSTAAFWAKDLAPRVWEEPTVHQDVNATINDLYGIVPINARSGFALGDAPPRAIRIINYWGDTVQLGVIRDQTQLNYNFDGSRWFFDYRTDPLGLTDAYDPANPDLVARWTDMGEWIAEVQRHWPGMAPPVNPMP